ncbi:uncharacterized protein LOC118837183 [Trichosurus vulpecula]|uniref:uncharacterized protein LOC118837183 n=1 Tax=Trichosurus vulpecula TaxID=9337 RepID=UPI00186B4760|nr:uncharacterized protein LOC118837183 [Trichosurus vulpecula]
MGQRNTFNDSKSPFLKLTPDPRLRSLLSVDFRFRTGEGEGEAGERRLPLSTKAPPSSGKPALENGWLLRRERKSSGSESKCRQGEALKPRLKSRPLPKEKPTPPGSQTAHKPPAWRFESLRQKRGESGRAAKQTRRLWPGRYLAFPCLLVLLDAVGDFCRIGAPRLQPLGVEHSMDRKTERAPGLRPGESFNYRPRGGWRRLSQGSSWPPQQRRKITGLGKRLDVREVEAAFKTEEARVPETRGTRWQSRSHALQEWITWRSRQHSG